jgi:hypothetical protein
MKPTMNKDNKIILTSTLHDPDLRLYNLTNECLPIINRIFPKKIVCCTPSTGEKIITLLKREGFNIFIGNNRDKLFNYKIAIREALNKLNDIIQQRVMYIDFDRLLHWVRYYPNELTELLSNNINVEYLHIGRTSRAFKTHPPTQMETEGIINEIGSKILGFSQIKDLISVCFIFTNSIGRKILDMQNNTLTGFYSSWPIVFWKTAKSKEYIEVEGLEWETSDQYKEEISKQGYDEWLKEFQSPQEWKKRVSLLHDGLTELSALVEFKYNY